MLAQNRGSLASSDIYDTATMVDQNFADIDRFNATAAVVESVFTEGRPRGLPEEGLNISTRSFIHGRVSKLTSRMQQRRMGYELLSDRCL